MNQLHVGVLLFTTLPGKEGSVACCTRRGQHDHKGVPEEYAGLLEITAIGRVDSKSFRSAEPHLLVVEECLGEDMAHIMESDSPSSLRNGIDLIKDGSVHIIGLRVPFDTLNLIRWRGHATGFTFVDYKQTLGIRGATPEDGGHLWGHTTEHVMTHLEFKALQIGFERVP